MNKIVLIGLVATIALIAGIYVRHADNSPAPLARSSDILPPFSFPALNGTPRDISDWHGKVLIINFWATWCPPCRKEIPEFITLQQELGKQGLQFIGVAVEDRQPVAEYIATLAINYPILVAEDAGIALSQRLGNVVNTVPFTVVVDRQGQIVHRQFGEFSRTQIMEIIEPLL